MRSKTLKRQHRVKMNLKCQYYCYMSLESGLPSLFLTEDAGVNVCHEVSSRGIGHHKAHMVCRLEAAVQVHQEWMP